MIDLHCHILPGLDDGAKSLEHSLEMAKIAVDEGITSIVATPHHRDGEYVNEKNVVLEQVDQLNTELQAHSIPLKVYPGQEIRYFHSFIDELQEGSTLLSLNASRYVLVELPSGEVPNGLEEMIYEFQIAGKVPIIAHPERNKAIIENPEILLELVQMGALSQVTSHSLVGSFGKKVQKVSLDLCRRNLIHLVASDAHNVRSRPFAMKEAFRVVNQSLGSDYEHYYKMNAERIFMDEMLEIYDPIVMKKGLFAKLFNRI